MAKILVVDDTTPNRLLVATILRGGQHEVFEAADGMDALVKLRSFRPDLVVCDILMPTMDGYEFVRQVRSDPIIAATEVIFYTANFLEGEAEVLAAACGVYQVLTKPCGPEQILQAVASGLARTASAKGSLISIPEFNASHLQLITGKLVQKTEELKHANLRLAALIELALQLASERDPVVMLDRFCSGVCSLFDARFAVLAMTDPVEPDAARWIVNGLPEADAERLRQFPIDAQAVEHALSSGLALRWGRGDGNAALRSAVVRSLPDCASGLVVPIVSLQHRHGWILLANKLGNADFSDDDERVLTIHAAQAGRIYESGSLYAKVQTQVEQLRTQAVERDRADVLLRLEHAVARALADAEDVASGLQAVLRTVGESQGWQAGVFWQVDEAAGVLRITADWTTTGGIPDILTTNLRCQVLRSGEGLAGRVWATGQALWAVDLPEDSSVSNMQALRDAGVRNASVVPVVNRGRVLGVLLYLGAHADQAYTRLQESTLSIGNKLGQFLQRKSVEAALHDSKQQLLATSQRVLEAQEAERRRVAHELHDELGQSLTAIKINLQASERFQGQTVKELNAENIRIIEDALQQVRRLALALRPSVLDDLGLIPALRWIADQTAQRSGFVVNFACSMPESRLPPTVETACFRIVQEALTNIARHSRATRVEIDLSLEGGNLMLCVQDDGCGFDVPAIRAHAVAGRSIGVLGMQERATLIGGHLEIESAPGQGCILRLRCPLRRRGEVQ